MPLQATSGAASYDAFGGGVAAAAVPNYIEDVFNTWLYTGTGATLTIDNGINLSGGGGLVWIKSRSAATDHFLFDTVRGALNEVNSNSTAAQVSLAASLTAFNVNGFSLGSAAGVNTSSATYASWSFREQPKFFDCVTYTGNGSTQDIPHNLQSVPGCIIVKRTDAAGDWSVWHKDASTLYLNSTAAVGSNVFGSVNASTFGVSSISYLNASGGTFVAYVFAHDAGGFGLTGTDNVISCGSYTGNGSATGPVVTLGYEPQWLMIKRTTGGTGDWVVFDTMRGIPNNLADYALFPNLINAEASNQTAVNLSATGFQITSPGGQNYNTSGSSYIYVAVRRGPMRIPTTGTSVLGLNARTGNNSFTSVTGGSGVTDAVIIKNRGASVAPFFASRLTELDYLLSSGTAAAVNASSLILNPAPFDLMNGVKVGTTSTFTNESSNTFINYLFSRAPSFFDQVWYSGTSVPRTIPHGLTVVPELMIARRINGIANWFVYTSATGATNNLFLNLTNASASNTSWNNTAPTAQNFSVGDAAAINGTGGTYINYLFSSCPGVSKVGSFVGTGLVQTVDCGFTSGARFILIKSTSAVGDWYVWDSARGIVVGNDPHFRLNSASPESTFDNWVNAAATGFELTNAGGNSVNSSGVSYIFLAIA